MTQGSDRRVVAVLTPAQWAALQADCDLANRQVRGRPYGPAEWARELILIGCGARRGVAGNGVGANVGGAGGGVDGPNG